MLAAIKAYALPAMLVAVILALLALGFAAGHSVAKSKGDSALATLTATHAEAMAASVAAHRETESEIRSELHALEQRYTKLEEEAQSARETDARLIHDLRSGARRMSVAVKSCGAERLPEAGPTDNESGAGGPERAELDPAVTESLLAIARDGDKYIRERNACIEQYEIVRRKLNSRTGQ